ncbi:MAG: hypothetical protein ACQCXQ_15825 [Verrucomicrobiales bacterium]
MMKRACCRWLVLCGVLSFGGADAGSVLITRQAPDELVEAGEVLLKNINRNTQADSYAYGTVVARTGGTEWIGGSTFVVPGSGTFDLSAISFKSATTQEFAPRAMIHASFYLNSGDSGSGDTELEQGEFIEGSDEVYSLAGKSITVGEYLTFNLSAPLTGLEKGREYGVVLRWVGELEENQLSLWRSNNKDRRDGGALAENSVSNITPLPSAVSSIQTENDPVIFVSSARVPEPADPVVRGTLEGWGVHLKYAEDVDGYFSTPKQVSGLETWRYRKIMDTTDEATVSVEDQVEYPAGTQVGKVFVPEAYDPEAPIGLLIFVNTVAGAFDVNRFESVLDEQYLIGASPEQTSNIRHDPWRIARILDLTVSLMDEYEIDPERVYIAGSSGGALMAAVCSLLYPDVYQGAVCVAHAIPISYHNDLYGDIWSAAEWREFVAQNQRYVWMAGEEDPAASWFRWYFPDWWDEGFVMDEYWVEGLGHAYPDESIFGEAVAFIDAPVQADRMVDFQDWTDTHFRMMMGRAHESVTDADTLATGDIDGDGRSNLEEFVFGGDPRQPDERRMPVVNGEGVIELQARHPISGARVRTEWSETLDGWTTEGAPLVELPAEEGDGVWSTRRFEMQTGGRPRAFFRFGAEEVTER